MESPATIQTRNEMRSRSWPHHVFIRKKPHSRLIESTFALLAVFMAAAWTGLASGLIEVAIQGARHAFSGSAALGSLQMNRHFLWMIPLTNLLLFMAGVLPVAAFALINPIAARRASRYLLTFLTALSLLLIVSGLHWIGATVLALGLSYRAVPVLERRVQRTRRFLAMTLPILVGAVAALGYGSYDHITLEEDRMIAALPKPAAKVPNVLFVVLDTMRGDRISTSSSPRQTTPNLAALAERGVIFHEARSSAPWTFPSHASMFTGRWPHELNLGTDRPLDGTYPTLAEFLSSKGYRTGGFVANTYFCNSWFGLGRGFAHYEDYYDKDVAVSFSEAIRCSSLGRRLLDLSEGADNVRAGHYTQQKNAEQVNKHFLEWVTKADEHPFFAFLNYIDSHDPYIPPDGYEGRFGLAPESDEEIDLLRSWHVTGKQSLTKHDIELATDGYDDCVAYVDEQIGKLFEELEERGILDNTLVVITGDHGEGFGEHNQFLHGKSLYREETHVPLIVFGPKGIPSRREVDDVVTLRELAVTIVDRLGFGKDAPFPGRSIARHWEGSSEPEEPILSEIEIVSKVSKNPNRAPAFRGPMASLILDGHVYIRDAVGREELYDIKNDPAEKNNLLETPGKGGVLKRCRQAYQRVVPPSHDRSRGAKS